jgi:two-component system NtrC family sensor kinase
VNSCHDWGIHALWRERYPFPRQGSLCTVIVPGMKSIRGAPPRTPERAPPAAAPRGTGPTPVDKGRTSVLVVDDEPLILKVVAQILGVEYDVTCEPSARAALERFRSGERFDLVLCDLMMPSFTGIDLYDALVEIEPDQARTMLFLTGGAFTPRAEAFLERIENAKIEKPFNQATLLRRVREFLAR